MAFTNVVKRGKWLNSLYTKHGVEPLLILQRINI